MTYLGPYSSSHILCLVVLCPPTCAIAAQVCVLGMKYSRPTPPFIYIALHNTLMKNCLKALADNGEAEILAVILDTAPVECAGAISVLTEYYGRSGKYAIGAYNVNTPGATLEMQHPLE